MGQQNLLLQEARRAEMPTEPQLLLLIESLYAPVWGWQLNHGLFIYSTIQSMLIFKPPGVSFHLVSWGKNLSFTLQSQRSTSSLAF